MNEDTSNEEVVEDTSAEAETETTKSEPSDLQEETQQETPQYYGGKYSSQEEFEKSHKELLNKLNEQGQEINRLKEPELAPDDQQIHDTIKNLGFVSKDEMAKHNAIQTQKAKDEAEITQLNLSDAQANSLRRYATHTDNLSKSMTECWDELQSTVGGKVVSRKTTIKPKTGTRDNSFKEKSPEQLAKLPKEEYDKYWVDYNAHMAAQ